MRRAIGAQAHQISGLVMSEAALVGAMGGVVEAATGVFALLVITMSRRPSVPDGSSRATRSAADAGAPARAGAPLDPHTTRHGRCQGTLAPMIATGLVLAALAALVHVYIFTLESVSWTSPRTRAVFGTTPEQAEATRELAFNQGFYNLFLAVVAVAGVIATATGATAVGAALVLAGTGSMLAAALVLVLSSPDKARAAVTQGTFPLLAVVATLVGLLA